MYTKFHENLTLALDAATGLRTDRHGGRIRLYILRLRKESLIRIQFFRTTDGDVQGLNPAFISSKLCVCSTAVSVLTATPFLEPLCNM